MTREGTWFLAISTWYRVAPFSLPTWTKLFFSSPTTVSAAISIKFTMRRAISSSWSTPSRLPPRLLLSVSYSDW